MSTIQPKPKTGTKRGGWKSRTKQREISTLKLKGKDSSSWRRPAMNSIQESKLLSGRRRKRRRHSRSPSKMSSKRNIRRRKLKRRLKLTQPPKLKMVMPRQRRPPRKRRDSPVKSTEPQ